jgi:hypothetical protein
MVKYSLILIASLFLCAPSHAIFTQVVSGSKYPVVVMVFQGSCQVNKSALDKIEKGAKTKGIWNKLHDMAAGALEGDGCANAGKDLLLKEEGDSINVSAGEYIIAYKDPLRTNKVVNPFPAICKVERGKTIYLNTRKSEGLRGLLGFAGDGGLTCSDKPPYRR